MPETILKLRTAFVAICLIGLAACGAGGSNLGDAVSPDESDGFTLNVLPESFESGGSAKTIAATVYETIEGVVVEIHADSAQNLRALYYCLEYDAASFSPLTVEHSPLLDGAASRLELSILEQPGELQAGIVLIHPDLQRGFSGSGVLATLSFTREPFVSTQRITSAVPVSEAARVSLELQQVDNPEPGTLLSWYYANPGDYNQDGLVGIADLTPLGVHFGDSGNFATQDVRSQVDGDGNGQIGIADLTPIGANFGNAISAYSIYSSLDSADYPTTPSGPNGSGAQKVGELNFTEMQRADGLRGFFERLLPAVQSDPYMWVRPVGSNGEGTPSNIVSQQGGNVSPSVTLRVDTPSGEAPLDVTLTAEALDPDGQIFKYEFDLDDDNVFELDNALDNSVSTTFQNVGSHTVWVRVTDDQGAQAVDSISINVGGEGNQPPVAVLSAKRTSGQWPYDAELDFSGSSDPDGEIVLIELDLTGDNDPDVQLAEGQLSMAYIPSMTGTSITLFVEDNEGARSEDMLEISADASGWSPQIVTVDSNITDCGELSLSSVTTGLAPVFTEKPCLSAISRSDADGALLSYYLAVDTDGESWGSPQPIANPINGALHSVDMRVHDNRPVLGYAMRNTVVGQISTYFRNAESAYGEAWAFPAVPYSGQAGPCVRIAEMNGMPVMACQRLDNGHDIWVEGDSDEWGSGGWAQEALACPATDDTLFAFESRSGLPGLCVQVPVNNLDFTPLTMDIGYAEPQSENIASWPGSPTTVAAEVPYSSIAPSLAFIDGKPMIAVVDGGKAMLNVIAAADEQGTQWGELIEASEISLTPGKAGAVCMLEVGGLPALFFINNQEQTSYVSYITALDKQGVTWTPRDTVLADGAHALSACVIAGRPACAAWAASGHALMFSISVSQDL